MDKPKRKYTVTAKVLAANRSNLLKANAVPKAVRYRPTPKRLAACHANLLKAREAVKGAGDHSPAYGCYRNGLYCASLEQSLGFAGESREEFRAHLERFGRAWAPQDEVEKELVRGMAETAWRRLRVFRGEARWEARSLEFRLREAARRHQRGDLPAGEAAERAGALAAEILGIFSTAIELRDTLAKLNGRLERLCRLFFLWRSPNAPQFQFFAGPRASEASMLERPAAALGNPFVSPGRIVQATFEKAAGIKPTQDWTWGKARCGGGEFELPGYGKALRYGLMHNAVRESSDQGVPGSQSGGVDAPVEQSGFGNGLEYFPAFLRQFEAAFGLPSSGSTGAELKMSSALPAGAEPSVTIRRVAKLAWERLQVFGRRAEEEAERLRELLESRVEGRESEAERRKPRNKSEAGIPDADLRRLAEEVLSVFWEFPPPMSVAIDLEQRLRPAFYKLLTKRYGKDAGLDYLKPPGRKLRDEDAVTTPWTTMLLVSLAEEINRAKRQGKDFAAHGKLEGSS